MPATLTIIWKICVTDIGKDSQAMCAGTWRTAFVTPPFSYTCLYFCFVSVSGFLRAFLSILSYLYDVILVLTWQEQRIERKATFLIYAETACFPVSPYPILPSFKHATLRGDEEYFCWIIERWLVKKSSLEKVVDEGKTFRSQIKEQHCFFYQTLVLLAVCTYNISFE